MFKFFGGPVAGFSMGLSIMETYLCTVLGMMTSVIIFSLIGSVVSKWYLERRRRKKKPIFNKKSRRIVMVWKRFGVGGIAFLTPILLSPVIGTIIVTILGAPKGRIFIHMLWSALFWGMALTLMLFQLQHLNLPFITR